MFNNLPASQGRKSTFWSPTTIVLSVAIHILLLGGAVYASVNAPVKEKRAEEKVTYVELEEEKPAEPEPPKPEEPPPPPPEPEQAPPPPKGFQELVPPAEPPPVIPDIDPTQKAVNVEDFTGIGRAGGTSTGVTGGTPQAAEKEETGNEAYDVSVVEEKPKLQNASEVQRQLQRLYPPLLRDAGIRGNVVLKFVIGADGRVEPGSVDVVNATHDAFGDASIKVTEKMKWKPAKVGGRAVRVTVTMPIQWTLES